ncbi:MAG TPA: histidine phosphatase family protein [Streptosporangiaceae bacterium]|nr:histidine phosphatase family protein [Streptosporangiaceae bacterium]
MPPRPAAARRAKRLAVLRHAKATHEPGFRDIDRPLTGRGRRDAAATGRFLLVEGIVPDLVLCSSSARTTQTWADLAAADPDAAAAEVTYDRGIYDADAGDLLEIVAATAADVGTLMIVGHNPAAAELVVTLTGDRDIAFPTCALAVIDLPGTWERATAGSGRLALLRTPKGAAR